MSPSFAPSGASHVVEHRFVKHRKLVDRLLETGRRIDMRRQPKRHLRGLQVRDVVRGRSRENAVVVGSDSAELRSSPDIRRSSSR